VSCVRQSVDLFVDFVASLLFRAMVKGKMISFVLITPIDWPASGTLRVSTPPPLDATFPTRFLGRKLDMHGHSLQRSLVLQHLWIRDQPLSNVAHAQWACLTWTRFNGPKFGEIRRHDHPPLLNSPNSKLQTSNVSTSSILNSARFIVTILCWRTSQLECLLPIKEKRYLSFSPQK
jgi:hypothetical protein